jgi:ribosomal protein S18 acetylase RimI-like enzyme
MKTEDVKVTIREAYFSDCFSISYCNQVCLPLYYNFFEIFCFSMSPSMKLIVSEVNDEFSGYLISSFTSSENLHIISFGVYEKFRRMKLGTKLVDAACEFAKKKSISSITLNVHVENESGIKFYEKIGFKVVSCMKDYYSGNLTNVLSYDAFKMEKNI